MIMMIVPMFVRASVYLILAITIAYYAKYRSNEQARKREKDSKIALR